MGKLFVSEVLPNIVHKLKVVIIVLKLASDILRIRLQRTVLVKKEDIFDQTTTSFQFEKQGQAVVCCLAAVQTLTACELFR